MIYSLIGYYSLILGLIVGLSLFYFSFKNFNNSELFDIKILSFTFLQLFFVVISFLCLIFSFYVSSAQTYNYHRFETYATAEKACVGNTSDAFVVKVNLDIDHLLNNGEYYVIDFGSNFNLGVRYAKVLNRYSGTGDADFYLDGSGIGSSTDVCSLIYRYHRFETFTTLQKAENRVCGTSTNHDGIWKVNILIDRLLDHDEVYQINQNWLISLPQSF